MSAPHRASATAATLLSSCRNLLHLQQTHSLIIRRGLEQDHLLISRFICLAADFSSPSYALSAFSRLLSPTLPLHNSLLKAHSHHPSAALPLFRLLRLSHSPDSFTFASLLKSCAANPTLFLTATSLHCLILLTGFESDVFIATSLVNFYGKSNHIANARMVFDSMWHRNEVSWTAMVTGYLTCGDLASAREVFDGMPKRNVVAWNAMVDGYVKSGDMVGARGLFDEMPVRDRVSFTTMIDGYAKAGDMRSARFLFDGCKKRDMFSWSTMISGYARNGMPGEALEVFYQMHNSGIRPDDFVVVGLMAACSQLRINALTAWVDAYVMRSFFDVRKVHILAGLIDMNVKTGNMERASALFESMQSRDLVSYCSMMQGYSAHGMGGKAVELFSRMLNEGIVPDGIAFTVVLTACSYVGLVEEGKNYFELMRNSYSIDPSPDHYACMVDLLGRAGQLEKAYELLKMPPVEHHAAAWGALLGACQMHGDVQLGESVARRLFEIEPQNAANYIALYNIYAAAGRWHDASEIRTMMDERGVRKIAGSTCI